MLRSKGQFENCQSSEWYKSIILNLTRGRYKSKEEAKNTQDVNVDPNIFWLIRAIRFKKFTKTYIMIGIHWHCWN